MRTATSGKVGATVTLGCAVCEDSSISFHLAGKSTVRNRYALLQLGNISSAPFLSSNLTRKTQKAAEFLVTCLALYVGGGNCLLPLKQRGTAFIPSLLSSVKTASHFFVTCKTVQREGQETALVSWTLRCLVQGCPARPTENVARIVFRTGDAITFSPELSL